MFELDWSMLLLAGLAALFIGFSKTGLTTIGVLVVSIMASIFPARESVGILLPMLITADLVAVTYYRHSVSWRTLISLLPWVIGGLGLGYMMLSAISSEQLAPLLGMLILTLIILQWIREKWGSSWLEFLPKSLWFVILMGTLAGFTTMIGNAAGSIMAIFLLVKGFEKREFIGTGAWFFLTVNLMKVPLYFQLDLITIESLTFNLKMVPLILLGTLLGIKFLPLIPQKYFNKLILVLAACGGLYLLLM